MRRAAVDLPFVPTTCTASNERCGSPSRSSSATMRSVPKPSVGHGLSDATQAVPSPAPSSLRRSADGIELAAVPLELLALAVHDLGRRVRDEALVREHRLGACELL